MTIVYLLIIALVLGLALSFISFLLEHIVAVIAIVVVLGGLIFAVLILKEKLDDKKAAKQKKQRADAFKAEVEKYNSFESKEDLPDNEDVLKELARKYEKNGDAAGQFAIAQKMYEKFGSGKLLIKCYFEGIGTEKNIQKGREFQKKLIYEHMTEHDGRYALSSWRSWWKADGFYVDLQSMLEIAREFCKNKNPLGVAFMEDVQLALVGDISEYALANGTWRNRLGYEPYSLYHTDGKQIKENELPEENYRNVSYDLTSYLVHNKCLFTINKLNMEKHLIPIKDQLKAEAVNRLQNPEKIEKDARLRAEKIWEDVYKLEAAKEAFGTGKETTAIPIIEDLSTSSNGYALIWLLRAQAKKGQPVAYFRLAELHKTRAYLFSTAKSKDDQNYIAKDLEKKGAELCKSLAARGNAEAQYHHGLHLEKAMYGIATTPDISKALEYYRHSARQNYPSAIGELLNMVDYGITFEEAESYAKWIQDNCSNCDTFEKRSAMRSFWAYQIRRKLSDQWTFLRKTTDEAPANNAAECFELAKKYIESEVIDVRGGRITAECVGPEREKNEFFYRNVSRIHTADWNILYDLVYEYSLRIYKVIYRNYDAFEWDRNKYQHNFIKDALRKHRNPIYEYDLICGALTQYCVSLRWKAAQDGNLDAIADLCKLYNGINHDRIRYGINVFSSAMNYWCKKALNTNSGRGYYIAGYYMNQKSYLQKALEMGYVEAQKEIDDIEDLENMKAESQRLFDTPYSSQTSSHRTVSSSKSIVTEASNHMDDLKANHNCKNLPYTIYDSSNNTWRQMHASENTAVYRNDELGEETIVHCDITSKTASGYNRTFHWW